MERRVERLLKGSDIERRGQVGDLFALADAYASTGDAQQAIRLYTNGLQVDPWRFEDQLKLAQLLQQHGDEQLAAEKAAEIYRHAEDERLKQAAGTLLSTLDAAGATAAEAGVTFLEGREPRAEMVFVPIGPIDTALLSEAIPRLQDELGLTYSIADEVLDPAELERTFKVRQATQAYERILPQLSPMQVLLLTAVGKLIHADLDTPEGQARLMNLLLWSRFNRQKRRGQLDTVPLLGGLRWRYPLGEPSHLRGYVGVTAHDVFSQGTNFVFAQSQIGYGVMSFARFNDAFYGEPPNRDRLRERFHRQAVTSTLFILGIPRCTSAVCVRAYPHSLREFDRKSAALCHWCTRQLQAVLKSQ